MRQLSEAFNHSPPNIRSRCVLVELYKVKKRLDQNGNEILVEEKKGEKIKSTIVPSFSDKTRRQTLSQFSIYFVNCQAPGLSSFVIKMGI